MERECCVSAEAAEDGRGLGVEEVRKIGSKGAGAISERSVLGRSARSPVAAVFLGSDRRLPFDSITQLAKFVSLGEGDLEDEREVIGE